MNFSPEFMDSLGPLGAMWLGEQFRTDQNTKNINQDIGLENIATARQTRDIQRQKLPFELSELQHKQAMQPLLLEQQGTKNKADLQKLDKEKFDTFFDQFRVQIPNLTGTPADAAVLGELAKKNGMDPADPRISKMIQVGASGNQEAIAKMMETIARMSEKHIQDMTKTRFEQGQQNARFEVEQAGLDRRNAATIAGGLERARIAAAARASASGKMHELLKITKGDPVKTKTALIQLGNEALRAGKTEEADAFFQQANDPALSALATNAQAQRAQTTLTTDAAGNPTLGSQGGTVPVPRAGPAQQGNPQNPQGVPPIGKIKIGNTEYELLENLPDGSKRIRDPATGRTGTVK